MPTEKRYSNRCGRFVINMNVSAHGAGLQYEATIRQYHANGSNDVVGKVNLRRSFGDTTNEMDHLIWLLNSAGKALDEIRDEARAKS